MAGEEFARVYSWGHDPKAKGDYETASPCNHIDLPQTLLEPILTRRATHAGWSLRFNTSFLKIESRSSWSPGEEVIVSLVRDDLTGQTYRIQSRFLFGCDGARSQVVREIGLPLIKKPGQGLAINVLLKADLSHLVKNRSGNLHWVINPENLNETRPPWAWACLARMIRPWNEWMFIFLPAPGADIKGDEITQVTKEEYLREVHNVIGDPEVKDVEIKHVGRWYINETVAERYSDGLGVFCLGDAVHRHPPFNGLGSNTCIQDAFNLAWKVDYVLSGKAGPRLLESYSVERQPVGVDIITRANQGLRDHIPWQTTLGMLEKDPSRRQQILAEFEDPGFAGRKRRQEFRAGIENTTTEFQGLGIEMNQRYRSDAVYLCDEFPAAEPAELQGEEARVKTHQVSTFPGRRLPHAWLNTRTPGKRLSTIDLAGHGKFCLLTGPGGQKWKEAAQRVSQKLGVEVVAYSVGWKQDYEDVYFDWEKKREVDEDGCVLARPDRFVAWRSKAMVANPDEKLEWVLRSVLAL